MRKLGLVISALLLTMAVFVLPVNDARSGGVEDPVIPDAQALIDKCWAATLEDRSSDNTNRMRAGIALMVRCLEGIILDQVEVMFPGPHQESLSRQAAREYLDNIEIGVQKM